MIIKRADYISDDPTPKVGGGVALTLKAERRGCIITYQTVAGTLNPGGHPGSYNGQDEYNDMLVIDESSKHGQWATAQHGDGRTGESSGLYARCPSNPNQRERERESMGDNLERGDAMTSVVRRLTPLE